MDNLRSHILKYYLYVLDRLERGYREPISSLLNEIFLEEFEVDNREFLINKLINEYRF